MTVAVSQPPVQAPPAARRYRGPALVFGTLGVAAIVGTLAVPWMESVVYLGTCDVDWAYASAFHFGLWTAGYLTAVVVLIGWLVLALLRPLPARATVAIGLVATAGAFVAVLGAQARIRQLDLDTQRRMAALGDAGDCPNSAIIGPHGGIWLSEVGVPVLLLAVLLTQPHRLRPMLGWAVGALALAGALIVPWAEDIVATPDRVDAEPLRFPAYGPLAVGAAAGMLLLIVLTLLAARAGEVTRRPLAVVALAAAAGTMALLIPINTNIPYGAIRGEADGGQSTWFLLAVAGVIAMTYSAVSSLRR